MTTTEILAEIRDRQGRDVLSDGKRLVGLFDDYSQGKLRPQSNALRVLVSCGGNQRIGQLRDASPLRQKTELHRLVQEMVTEYSMQEAMAREVCGAVWEAFLGTEAPLTQLAEPVPAQSRTLTSERAAEMPKPRSESVSRPEPREAEPVQLTPPPTSRTPDTSPKRDPEPQKEKLPEPTPQKRVIDKSTWILLILGVMGVVGFLMMASMTAVELAQGKRLGDTDWIISSICALLAFLTGRRSLRLYKEGFDPAKITNGMSVCAGVAYFAYCGILCVCIFFLVDGVDTKNWYAVAAAPLSAAGAVFQISWAEAVSGRKMLKPTLKDVAIAFGLGIVVCLAAGLIYVVLFLLIPTLIENATAKGVVIFIWVVVQIGLVVLAFRFIKENGYLLNPRLKKQTAMLCGVGTVLLSLWGGYINLTFEEGIRPGQVAAMLLLLVLTVRRMVWIQKNGFEFSNISKLSRNYSLTVGFLFAFFVWGMFITLPIFVVEIFPSTGSGVKGIILFILFYMASIFEALWHVSKWPSK